MNSEEIPHPKGFIGDFGRDKLGVFHPDVRVRHQEVGYVALVGLNVKVGLPFFIVLSSYILLEK